MAAYKHDNLMLEDGSYLLLEDNGEFLLESSKNFLPAHPYLDARSPDTLQVKDRKNYQVNVKRT